MKQTAVEWLVEQLAAIRKQNSGYRNIGIELRELIEQAKAMEKEQIKDAFEYAWLEWAEMTPNAAVKYYEETFKSE